MIARRVSGAALLIALLLMGVGRGLAQSAYESAGSNTDSREAVTPTASVVIDGRTLFNLRGLRAFPAEERAKIIRTRILAFARDRSLDARDLSLTDTLNVSVIGLGDRHILEVTDADADLEGIDKRLLAEVYRSRVRAAVESYRTARSKAALVQSITRTGLATALAFALVLFLKWMLALLGRWVGQNASRVKSVSYRSFEVLGSQRMLLAIHGGLRFLLTLSIGLVVFLYAQFTLSQFPWTLGIGKGLGAWLIAPFEFLGRGFVSTLPSLIFLAILVVLVRFLIRLLEKFFAAIGRGEVNLPGFYPDWAGPTFGLVRVGIVLLSLVVAYPYIPGSSTEAFKGVSIFAAALFSLGSSSFIANLIAGYTMVFRRAFGDGDLIKIGDVTGFVTRRRLQVTHLRTIKNEEVIIPNSTMLNSEIMNYSTLGNAEGIILHTTVGIGYETPWRQVEAMLLEAARRTPGLLSTPSPFVLQKALGDFAVVYQINAYCKEPGRMFAIYSSLHANILDVFNEYGVQIMTPAYESDPSGPKIVPPERWHLPPAPGPS